MDYSVLIVDRDDQPIGFKDMFEAISNGDTRRVVSVIILNKNEDKVLIQQRSEHVYMPLLWDMSVSGHLRPGQEYEKAAIRQAQQELGITIEHPRQVDRFLYEYPLEESMNGKASLYIGLFSVCYEGELKPDPREVHDTKWISFEDLARSIQEEPDSYSPVFIEMFKRYSQKVGKPKGIE